MPNHARFAFLLSAAIVLMALATPSSSRANPQPAKAVGLIVKGELVKVDPFTPVVPGAAPNLAVVALTSDAQCAVRVTIKNQGAALPDTMTTVSYQAMRNDPATADTTVTTPAAPLRAPGSIVTVTYPGLLTAYTPAVFSAHVNSNVRDHRTGAGAAQLTQSLMCGATPPNLTMIVKFEDGTCAKTILVHNSGGALARVVSTNTFEITRKDDGWDYRSLLVDAGIGTGETLAVQDDVRTFESYWHSITSQFGSISNAVASAAVPARCKGTKPAYGIELADIFLDSNCRVTAKLRNSGGPAWPPYLAIEVVFQRDGTSVSGVTTGSWQAVPANGSIDVTSGLQLGPPLANIAVIVKPRSGDQIGPKGVQLNCQK